MRNNIPVAMVICFLINVGMWFERYNIIVSSLVEDFVLVLGTLRASNIRNVNYFWFFGWFFMWLLIFTVLPAVSMSELKLIMPKPNKNKH